MGHANNIIIIFSEKKVETQFIFECAGATGNQQVSDQMHSTLMTPAAESESQTWYHEHENWRETPKHIHTWGEPEAPNWLHNKVVILWDIFKDRLHGYDYFVVLSVGILMCSQNSDSSSICVYKCSWVLMLANVNKIQSVSRIGTFFWRLMLANINNLLFALAIVCEGQ